MLKAGRKYKRWLSDQKGVVVIITALGIVMMLALVGLVVDLGFMYVVKSELQRAADAGAVAGSRALFYPQNSPWPQCGQALNTGTQIAQANLANGAVPTVSNIQTGRWDFTAGTFDSNCSSGATTFTNAVSLSTQIVDVPLFVMGSFGLGPYTLTATGIGVTDFVGEFLPGALAIPVAVGLKYAGKGTDQHLKIYFNNENQDTGGWYAIPPNNPNTNYLRNMIANPLTSSLKKGDSINVNTGVHNAALDDLSAFVGKDVWLPVIDTTTFNGTFNILGFLSFRITDVGQDGGPGKEGEKAGKKYIEGDVKAKADSTAPSGQTGPGGGSYGLLSAPRLVQ